MGLALVTLARGEVSDSVCHLGHGDLIDHIMSSSGIVFFRSLPPLTLSLFSVLSRVFF